MSEIRVIPLVEETDAVAFRRRKMRIPPPFAWRYAMGVLVMFVVFGAFLLPAIGYSRPPAPNPALLFEVIINGAGVAWGGVVMASTKYRRMNIAIWGTLFIMYSILPISFYRTQRSDYVSFMYFSRTANPLRTIWLTMQMYIEEHGELPKSLVLLASDGYISSDQMISYQSSTTSADIGIDELTLAQWEAGPPYDDALSEAFIEAAESLPEPSSWEQLGDFLMCRQVILPELPGDLIVGISPHLGKTDDRFIVQFDGNCIRVNDATKWWIEQNELRATLGLDPIPDKLP